MKDFDLGNGWKVVPIITSGYEGWCNLVVIDPNTSGRPALLPPECADMVRKLSRVGAPNELAHNEDTSNPRPFAPEDEKYWKEE